MIEFLLLTTFVNLNEPLYSSKPVFSKKIPLNNRVVDRELLKYVEKFEDLWGKRINFRVTFGEMLDNYAGYCQIYPLKRKIVVINKKNFKKYNEDQKEVLLFHEMGHCALYKDHNNDLIYFKKFSRKYPKSIMYDSVFNIDQILVYRVYKKYYHEELIND